jgi:hypothetical protein
MAATLKELYDMAQDTALRERVLAAVVKQGNYVLDTEVTTGPKTVKRRALARQAVLGAEALVAPFARQCANNATISNAATAGAGVDTSAVPDADVEYVVGIRWDTVAGVEDGEAA